MLKKQYLFIDERKVWCSERLSFKHTASPRLITASIHRISKSKQYRILNPKLERNRLYFGICVLTSNVIFSADKIAHCHSHKHTPLENKFVYFFLSMTGYTTELCIHRIELWIWTTVTYFKVQSYIKPCHVSDVTNPETDSDLLVIRNFYVYIVLAPSK